MNTLYVVLICISSKWPAINKHPLQQLERMVIFQCNRYGELGQLVLKYREIYGNITYSNFYIQSTLKVP